MGNRSSGAVRPLGSDTLHDQGIEVPAISGALDDHVIGDLEFGLVCVSEHRDVDLPLIGCTAGGKVGPVGTVVARPLPAHVAAYTEPEHPKIPSVSEWCGGRCLEVYAPEGNIKVRPDRGFGCIANEADLEDTREFLSSIVSGRGLGRREV